MLRGTRKFGLIITLVFAVVSLTILFRSKNTLRVGYPVKWDSLVPALQHTAYGDALLSNQFESLVREGHGGVITPGLALSWTVSSDLRVYTFKIDTSRYFSNGVPLSAHAVKSAWEQGLALNPESTNSSLQDVLYLVEGIEGFAATKSLSGLRVLGPDSLEVRFKKPFRTALSEFATGRMSIFVSEGTKTFGTGPYIISEDKDQLTLSRNPHFPDPIPYAKVIVSVVPPEKINEALVNNRIDLYAFADRAALDDCETTSISCFAGVESGHSIVIPNGMDGRFLSNSKYRLALQFLIHRDLTIGELPSNYRRNLRIDPQVYLDLQPGRIPTEAAHALVDEGAKYVHEFVKATEKSPLYLVTSEMNNWVQARLERAGVRFSDRSGKVETRERVKMYYKTFEPDLFVSGTSVASGDPDGLFHILAKDGAITSPVLYRKSVSEMLETGRQILNLDKLDEHYSKVTREILIQVPFVHVGFIKGLFAYHSGRVEVSEELRGREGNQFTLFKPK